MPQPQLSQLDAARNVNRLRRILEAAKLLNSTLDPAELSRIILKIVRDEVGVDRGTVFVVDHDRKEVQSLVAQEVDGTEIRLPFGSGIAGTTAETGQVIDVRDAYADSRFNPSIDVVLPYRTKDIFCMPVVNRNGQTVGVLELLNRTAAFQEDDLEFLQGVSVHIGLALENAWLHRELLEKRRMDQELLLAREIQQNLCPTLPENRGRVQMAASSTMCEAVGGDYLDYYPLQDDRFILMLGDVSGKGIGAALVMTSLHATCRALLRGTSSLEQIVRTLNQSLLETTRVQTYVTLIAVLVDTEAGKLHCVRAGHHPPLLLDDKGNCERLEQGGGLPLGLFPGLKFSVESYDVRPGSIAVVYTDGVTETENSRKEQFSLDRLQQVAAAHRAEGAGAIHDAIRGALKEFGGETRPADDSTLVVVKF